MNDRGIAPVLALHAGERRAADGGLPRVLRVGGEQHRGKEEQGVPLALVLRRGVPRRTGPQRSHGDKPRISHCVIQVKMIETNKISICRYL